jgi:hypothetical protein
MNSGLARFFRAIFPPRMSQVVQLIVSPRIFVYGFMADESSGEFQTSGNLLRTLILPQMSQNSLFQSSFHLPRNAACARSSADGTPIRSCKIVALGA